MKDETKIILRCQSCLKEALTQRQQNLQNSWSHKVKAESQPQNKTEKGSRDISENGSCFISSQSRSDKLPDLINQKWQGHGKSDQTSQTDINPKDIIRPQHQQLLLKITSQPSVNIGRKK